ncbi:unnamed protein product [Cylindrotheca closterium]|uniref:Uncharacterized protein n=1 Tax=Cylindrotheca closterium TaxID=2856 RepID=A0AAD2G4R9_9STRA|nr:unnamed protein product [Cylindrotheca closterium]
MLLKKTGESAPDASEESSSEDSSSPLQRDAETELQNTDNNDDNSGSEDFEEGLNDEVSQETDDKMDARNQKSREPLKTGTIKPQEGNDADAKAAPSDSNFDESMENGANGEISEADSDEEVSSEPLEEAKKAKDLLLKKKLIERQQKRNNGPRDPSIKRFRNIDLFSLKKRHSKSDLFEGEEGEEGDDCEGSGSGSDEGSQNENVDNSPTTNDLENSDSKKTSSAETESASEPSVPDTANIEGTGTHSEQEEIRHASEAQQAEQEEATDPTNPTDPAAGNDETNDGSQTLTFLDEASLGGKIMHKGDESQSVAEPEARTREEGHGENDSSSDSARPTKVEAPASSERDAMDEKSGDAANQDDKSKSKKSKDSKDSKDSKKMKSKKKEKRKDKKSKSRKSTSKKTKPKRKSHGSAGSQRLQGKRPSVPLDTLDEQSAHDPDPHAGKDPRQSETTLSLLLNSIEQAHVVSKSNQTVGEYSAGSFISDTGWSDGTSSSYDTDEDDISLSSSGSLKAEQDNGEEHEKEDTANQISDPPVEQQVDEVPPAPEKDQSSPKLANTHIVKRLFGKKKYDSLEGDADVVQKSPSAREATTPRKSTSLNIVANLFRRRKQKPDVLKTPEDDSELEKNAGEAKEEETNDTDGANEVERQQSPKSGAEIAEDENIEGGASGEAASNDEDEAVPSLQVETAASQEDSKVDGSGEITLNEENAEELSAESNAATPLLQNDGNVEGRSEDGEHPNVQGVEENGGVGSTKEKHKTHPKKKDGQTKKKKDKAVSGNRDRSDSAPDDPSAVASTSADRRKEKEGGSKKRSKSAASGKKRRKPIDSNKEKDSSPGQEAKALAKKKTKKPVQNRATLELGVEQEEEEEEVSKAKAKRKTAVV